MSNNGEASLPNGSVIKERYEIVRLLGAGGMGAVYEARDRVLDKRVALKIMHPDVAQDEQMNARFIQEARAASAFKHRHVVESLDFGSHDGAPFLVMEFLEGESFADLLQREQKIAPERAVSLLEPIARALAKAHQSGIIHRDVKPDNVFLAKGDDGECVPKLVDFGIAKRTTEGELRLTKTSVAMGTPFYMPPEQAMGAKDVTPAADQYAFAAMLFESVSAKFPHDGESYNALIINKVTKEPLSLLEVDPSINDRFAAVVMKALSREPGGRYPTMNALRDALVESVGGRVDAPSMVDVTGSLPRATDRDASTAPAKAIPAAFAATAVSSESLPRMNTAAIPADSIAAVERPTELSPAPASKRSNKGLVIAATAVLALLGGGAFAMSRGGGSTNVQSAGGPSTAGATGNGATNGVARRTLRVRVVPANAQIEVDGRPLGQGAAAFEAAPGTEVELRMSADGYVARTERLRLDSDQSIERMLDAQPHGSGHGASANAGSAQAADGGAVAASEAQTPSGRRGSNRGRNSNRSSGGLQLGRTGVRLDLGFLPH